MNRRKILSDYVDETERTPFAYGVNDCLLWVAGAVKLLTEVDHAADYRGRYTSLAGGKKLIGMSLLRFVAERLPAIDVSRASDGDVAVVRQGREWGFGIFIGAQIYLPTMAGIGILPRSRAAKAFEVR